MLINAHSGLKNSKAKLLDAIDVFCANGYEVSVYVTQAANDAYEYLKRNRIRYDIVCVFGGDGTMNEVTNALMRRKEKPLLGYFPSGTMNDFGSNFDLGYDPKTIAERICQRNEIAFDVGCFNGRYFNYVAAFGAMCDVPFTTDRDAKERLGNIAYILEGIGKLPEVKPIDIRYTVKGKTHKRKVLFGLVYSGSRVAGMQLETKSRSNIDDGMFNVLIVDYVPTFFDAPDILTILIQNEKYIHRFRTENISFEFDEHVVWTLDGEEARPGNRAEITIINKALKLLA